MGFLLLPLHTASLNLHAHTPLSSKASGHRVHDCTRTQPSRQHCALDSVKSFQSHFLFLNLSQYKPCSKCYEKMYMFIQGRLWQDTGVLPLGRPREEGLEARASSSLAPLLPPPSPPRPQEPAAPCPELSALTPVPRGSSQVTFAISPHPGRKGPGAARPSPLQLFTPLGQTRGTLLCTGRVRGAVSSSCHCCSRRTWSSSSSR